MSSGNFIITDILINKLYCDEYISIATNICENIKAELEINEILCNKTWFEGISIINSKINNLVKESQDEYNKYNFLDY
jgi:uncharacterized membrane protein YqiK